MAPGLLDDYDPNDVVRRFDAMRGNILGGLPPVRPPQVQSIPFGGNLPGSAPAAWAAGAKGVGRYFSDLESRFRGLQMTSGYRDPEHNARVGGVPNSWHTQKDEYGHERARDYVGSAREMQEAAAWAKANGAQEVLIHNAGSGQHLHVAW